MKDRRRESLWQRFARWQRLQNENHPMLSGFIVEVFGALALIFLSLVIVPASIEIKSEQLTDNTSMVMVKNEGFLEGDSIFKVYVDKPLTAPPEILIGRQYVRHIVLVGDKTYTVEIKDLHRNERVEIEFKTDRIVVED